ncbi:uncharacterized protein LOC144887196 isoform X2 [Branchiostoma floridae x Branchiostoma japonicum]
MSKPARLFRDKSKVVSTMSGWWKPVKDSTARTGNPLRKRVGGKGELAVIDLEFSTAHGGEEEDEENQDLGMFAGLRIKPSMHDPAYAPGGKGYPPPGQPYQNDPAYAPGGGAYPPPGQPYQNDPAYAPGGGGNPLPGQPFQDDPAYPAPRHTTAPPPPMLGPPPGQAYPPPGQTYPPPGQTYPPPGHVNPPPGPVNPPPVQVHVNPPPERVSVQVSEAPPPYSGERASEPTVVTTGGGDNDSNMDFCSRCWKREHPHKWYSLSGKGCGWIVVLIVMYFFVGIFAVIAFLAFAILTSSNDDRHHHHHGRHHHGRHHHHHHHHHHHDDDWGYYD